MLTKDDDAERSLHSLVVGCPVRARDWILPTWFEHIECAAMELGRAPTYVFVVDLDDEATVATLLAETNVRERPIVLIPVQEDPVNDRKWNHHRYKHMVELRNLLLKEVRSIGPELFWSVDSDILVHYNSLLYAYEALDRFDAVGSRTYMTEKGTWAPSWANYTSMGGLQRRDAEGTFPVGVIMAMKLMTPPAYNVDYAFNNQGEDTGWSLNCRKAGVKLGWDGRCVSKHVYAREQLYKVDKRCGY